MRALCDVVKYERDPFEKIDQVVGVALAGPVDEYVDALHQALTSSASIARLGPEYHPEPVIRRLLAEVRRRLISIH